MAKKPEGPKKTTATPAKKTPEKKAVKKSQSAPVQKTAKSTNQKPASQPPKKVAPKPVNKEPPKKEVIDYNEEYPFTKEGLVQWYDNLEDGIKNAIGDDSKCTMPQEYIIDAISDIEPNMRVLGLLLPEIQEIIQFGRIVRLRMLGVVMDNKESRELFMDNVKAIPENYEDYNEYNVKTDIYLADLNSVSASFLGKEVGRSLFRRRSADLIIETIERMTPIGPTIATPANEAKPKPDEAPKPEGTAKPSHGVSELE